MNLQMIRFFPLEKKSNIQILNDSLFRCRHTQCVCHQCKNVELYSIQVKRDVISIKISRIQLLLDVLLNLFFILRVAFQAIHCIQHIY